jgi:hypothetical protein
LICNGSVKFESSHPDHPISLIHNDFPLESKTYRSNDDQEAILCGDFEPFHPLSKHEGHRNALRAFLTGDGSVKELPEHIVHALPAQAAQPVSLAQPTQLSSPPPSAPPAAAAGQTLQEIADKWVKERAPITTIS